MTLRRPRPILFALAALIGFLVPAPAHAAPSITRSHLEFSVAINDCGIGTLDLSIDAFNLVNLAKAANDAYRSEVKVVDRGSAFDSATGNTYRFIDRFTQAELTRTGQPSVESAERTIIITGGRGGLLARGLVHSTVRPDGSIVSAIDMQFLRCL